VKMSMRQLTKYFLLTGFLALGLQSAWAFSLLGPEANGGDAWQVNANGYNPILNSGAPPFFLDSLSAAPKNLGEGYRRNTPLIYYTFDASFSDYFGSNGEAAVQSAFDILNGLTNMDRYSTSLSEFPLNSESENYLANALGLVDLKSTTLALLMEQLGLADPVRYMWVLHDRLQLPGCTVACPACMEYLVTIRNFDYFPTPLDQIQYSDYINNELYSYVISEICGSPVAPPNADAIELPADPLNLNPPVASGNGEEALPMGFFYTGLTRDDVGGLRWLYSTNNWDTTSPQYRESAAAGSLLFSTNFTLTPPPLLATSNLNVLVLAAMTNSPAALQALFPGLSVDSTFLYYTNMVSVGSVTFVTVFPYGYPGGIVEAVTNYVTNNAVPIYNFSFDNVVTNKSYAKTSYAIQTVTFGPPIGQPADSPFILVTNTSPVLQSNVVSGDFFIITNGTCGPNIIQTIQTNVNVFTNNSVTVVNPDGSFFIQNLISYFTNYVFAVNPCTLVTNGVGDYQGVGRLQFVRVRDDNYDYLNGQFFVPITNQYTMVVITNGQLVTQTFQRVLAGPDLVFGAADLAAGPSSGNAVSEFTRGVNFNQANIQPGLAGPGTIDPGSSNAVVFDKVGPVFDNQSLSQLNGPNGANHGFFVWGSFDGTTNPPVIYPNGASLANLAASSLVQISPPPPALPNGTNRVAYNVAFTVTNATPPYTWTLAPNSAGLPYGSPNLTLSPGGLISGTPTNSATYNNILIQMTDSGVPPRTVQMIYSLTIN